MLFPKAFQGISEFVIFNHEDIPSLQSLSSLMKSLAAAVEDFGKDPDSVTAKDFLLLIMGYYNESKKSRVSYPKARRIKWEDLMEKPRS